MAGSGSGHTEHRDAVEVALAELYPEQLPNAQRSAKGQLADAIRRGDKARIRGGLAIAPAATIKPMRSYGDDVASS